MTGKNTKPVLVIHGGAGTRDFDEKIYSQYRESLQKILNDSFKTLQRTGSALRAVIEAVERLEDDPLYNAGKGSKIQGDGRIRMSASVMDGAKRRFSGCVNVQRIKNPVRLAEALLPYEDRVLSEKGAEEFAKAAGLSFASPYTQRARDDYKAKKAGLTGTVGAVALDLKGRLAAATSTGGRGFEYPHRVSDTPTIAGNFANSDCAVSATGVGEEIVEFAVASRIATMVEVGKSLKSADSLVFESARRAKARFGWIAVDKRGHFKASTLTKAIIWGAMTPKGIELF